MSARWKLAGVSTLIVLAAACGSDTTDTTATTVSSSSTEAPPSIGDFDPPESTVCFFLSDFIFVGEGEAPNVADFLVDQGVGATAGFVSPLDDDAQAPPFDPTGIDVVTLDEGHPHSAVQITEFLRSLGTLASPIHAVGMANHWQFAPGDDPVDVTGDHSLDEIGTPGSNEYIAVVDTGLIPSGNYPWLTDGVAYDASDAQDLHDLGASHGTFIVSLLRQIAPRNPISFAAVHPWAIDFFSSWPEGALDADTILPSMLTTELDTYDAISRLIARHTEGDLRDRTMKALSLSWGTYPCESDYPEEDVDALGSVLSDWEMAFPDSVIFAAAGNEPNVHGGFVPAALPSTVGVGAGGITIDQVVWDDGKPVLENTRSWVDVVAPGCDLVGVSGGSPNGEVVAWSGSSFATPLAAGFWAGSPNTQNPTQVSIGDYPQLDQERC